MDSDRKDRAEKSLGVPFAETPEVEGIAAAYAALAPSGHEAAVTVLEHLENLKKSLAMSQALSATAPDPVSPYVGTPDPADGYLARLIDVQIEIAGAAAHERRRNTRRYALSLAVATLTLVVAIVGLVVQVLRS